MRLSKIVKYLSIKKLVGDVEKEVSGIFYDSRKVEDGGLFVAIRGLTVDGHRFITDAVLSGAVAVILENDDIIDDEYFIDRGVVKIVVPDSRKALAVSASVFYNFPSRRLKLIGVTGTNGKTTTAHLIKSIIEAGGGRSGLIGTINYIIGDRVIPAGQTTPEAVELNGYLDEMLKEGMDACVMEVSSHALALDRVYSLDFDIGIFTNLTRDHLDFHGTFEAYFQAKKILFDSLKQDAFAIYNIDDPNGERIVSEVRGRRISFGMGADADVSVKRVDYSFDGTKVEIKLRDGGELKIDSKLIGEFNVYNILAGVSAGLALGFDLDVIRRGIERVDMIKGRFESMKSPDNFTVIIDYSHTPDALEKCIDAILHLKKLVGGGRLITVFGCGGDRDREKRPMMGRIATEKSDITVITSDNPRFEDPERIIDDILRGVRRNSIYYIFVDRREAIERALRMAESGDIVLIAGKGHEEYQIINDMKIPFSDKSVVQNFFRSKKIRVRGADI